MQSAWIVQDSMSFRPLGRLAADWSSTAELPQVSMQSNAVISAHGSSTVSKLREANHHQQLDPAGDRLAP